MFCLGDGSTDKEAGERAGDAEIFNRSGRMNRLRNEYIKETAHVRQLRGTLILRLEWVGYVGRREPGHIGKRTLEDGAATKGGKEGKTERRFVDVVRADMQAVGVTREDAGSRGRWLQMIRCDDRPRVGIPERTHLD